MPRDLNELPRLRDSLSYLYVEKAVIERDQNAIVLIRGKERVAVPISSLTVLMMGPGTSVTHAAVRVISESGCLAVWCGEHAMRYYAMGMGETRSAEPIMAQARCFADPSKRLDVARKMFAIRFPDMDTSGLSMQQLRGLEGVRMRTAYRLMARKHNIPWKGRNYNPDLWDEADDLNTALSVANVCLYAICQAAIVTLGYSPALGFIHNGKQMSFVYDMADLYKVATSIPAAFEAAASSRAEQLDRRVRVLMRQAIRKQRLLARIAEDLQRLFQADLPDDPNCCAAGDLWDDKEGSVRGGVNYAPEGS